MLPARVPNLLVNGATGIAVGMATSIPPHNLGEVCTGAHQAAREPGAHTAQLCRWVKGPDFPTGGQILNSADELKEIYKTGSGAIRLRGTWEMGASTRARPRPSTSPASRTWSNKADARRAHRRDRHRREAAAARGREGRVDRRRADRADDQARRRPEDGDGVPVQAHAAADQLRGQPDVPHPDGEPRGRASRALRTEDDPVALPALPAGSGDGAARARARALRKRIHILEGFEKVFDALDEILRIVRKSDGKSDAAEKIMSAFGLDAEQTDAILELKIYRLARLEILVITNELADKRKRAKQISALLADDESRWALVREELDADPEDLRQCQDRSATHADRSRGRRGGILRRRFHRRRGQRRHPHPRWLDEAAEGSEGPGDDPPPRGRPGDRRARRQHARDRGVLHELRHRLLVPNRGRAGVHGLRRAHSAPVQVPGRRARGRRREP